jgi:hypothetical protein
MGRVKSRWRKELLSSTVLFFSVECDISLLVFRGARWVICIRSIGRGGVERSIWNNVSSCYFASRVMEEETLPKICPGDYV